jgi:two-component system osmolarity sensor histidine kinase EnvZ
MKIRLERPLRRFLPRSLLARSLLIILIPVLLTEAIALQIFYGSHLNTVSRRLSAAVAGEVMETLDLLNRYPDHDDRDWIIASARDRYGLVMRIEPGAHLVFGHHINIIGPMDDDLAAAMREVVRRPFTMDWTSDPQKVLLRVGIADGVLAIEAPRKRLDTGAIYLFLLWLTGSAVILFTIAALFMRNQVRAIRRLSRAAETVGTGRDSPPIKPEGAVEVRRAASAFNRMQERISRFVSQRTDLLAGVSHDLRTPLTRMRLSLAMLPDAENSCDVAGMIADVDEMERMIDGYIAFARGEGAERIRTIDLSSIVEDVCASARRVGALVDLKPANRIDLPLRPDAIRRALTNLVDNAQRHARRVVVAMQAQRRQVQVVIDDDGPGIPPDKREHVFRAFESTAQGGTGLGLTIARDIVRAHGGDIVLETSPLGGLRARVWLPL